MDVPQHSMNVWVTLSSGKEIMAYWFSGQWWEGIAYDPTDKVITERVISWREVGS